MSDDLNKDLKNLPFATRESLELTTPTPRTDANVIRGFDALRITKDEEQWVRADVARELERALSAAEGQVKELEAALEEARKDGDRIDCIEQLPETDANVELVFSWTHDGKRYAQGLRTAIDAARAKESP